MDTTTVTTAEIDFVQEADTYGELEAEVAYHAAEHWPGVAVRIKQENGPAGGASVLELTANDPAALRAALLVHYNGDEAEVDALYYT